MTPIEQLVRISERQGLKPVERRVGTHGARKIYEFSKPMPKYVRELGCTFDDLSYNYWAAGDEGLKEGFGDIEQLQDIEFPADLLSMRRLRFYLRKLKFRWKFWRDDRLVSALKREWRKPDAHPVHLDSDLIGPKTGEYQRIEAASALVSEKLTSAIQQRGFKLYWSYGDSSAWRAIVAIPTESALARFVSTAQFPDFAREVVDLIASTVQLERDFKLYIELDSDERVNAAEGWFFRIKSDPKPDREFLFDSKGQRISNA